MEYLELQNILTSGSCQTNEPDGEGIMKLPDGTTYTGQFQSGKFHGKGTLTFPEGKIVGNWIDGMLMEYEIFFNDGLEFQEEKWDYITPADRRFYEEIIESVPKAASRVRVGEYQSAKEFRDGSQ